MIGMLDQTSDQIEIVDLIRSMGYRVRIVRTHRAHTITRHEITIPFGVRVQSMINTANDLAVRLGVDAVRILPVPGAPLLAVEVPNRVRSWVSLADIPMGDGALPVPIGVTTDGSPVTADLTRLPHVLISGTTGSGKSSLINAMIIRLIEHDPSYVRLLLVDPKRVELTPYAGLPHLHGPVCTEPHTIINRIEQMADELDLRYALFQQCGVRDIAEYRQSTNESMAYMVVIVDELADIILSHKKIIESPLVRLAQLGRAAGIHLILATQRPIKPVVTGLISANVPARLAFAVPTALDSRIALGLNGAETLLGQGDGLWLPPGQRMPTRIQGPLTTLTDIQKSVDQLAGWPRKDATP